MASNPFMTLSVNLSKRRYEQLTGSIVEVIIEDQYSDECFKRFGRTSNQLSKILCKSEEWKQAISDQIIREVKLTIESLIDDPYSYDFETIESSTLNEIKDSLDRIEADIDAEEEIIIRAAAKVKNMGEINNAIIFLRSNGYLVQEIS